MAATEEVVLTPRLRLVPIGPDNAADYWLVHDDDAVVPWYDGWRPTRHEAAERAQAIAESCRLHGVHKWMAYDRATGEVVGRGGLSRTPMDDDWGQLYAFLPDEPWVREAHPSERPFRAHAHWLEIGWALRREHWGQGYASEIGQAGLTYAFDVLGARAVVSCAVRHNLRSRAVMEHIGLRYAGEILSRGTAEGEDVVRDDAPFVVFLRVACGAAPGLGLRRADEVLAGGELLTLDGHRHGAALDVDVAPALAVQLATTEPAEGGEQHQRPLSVGAEPDTSDPPGCRRPGADAHD